MSFVKETLAVTNLLIHSKPFAVHKTGAKIFIFCKTSSSYLTYEDIKRRIMAYMVVFCVWFCFCRIYGKEHKRGIFILPDHSNDIFPAIDSVSFTETGGH